MTEEQAIKMAMNLFLAQDCEGLAIRDECVFKHLCDEVCPYE